MTDANIDAARAAHEWNTRALARATENKNSRDVARYTGNLKRLEDDYPALAARAKRPPRAKGGTKRAAGQ